MNPQENNEKYKGCFYRDKTGESLFYFLREE